MKCLIEVSPRHGVNENHGANIRSIRRATCSRTAQIISRLQIISLTSKLSTGNTNFTFKLDTGKALKIVFSLPNEQV
jgi:hypothetical protein